MANSSMSEEIYFNIPISEDLLEFHRDITFGEKTVTQEQFAKAKQFHAEELLLKKIFNKVAKQIEPGDHCLEVLWDTIEEYIEKNERFMRQW